MECASLGGMRYFITFVDEYTRLKVDVYFPMNKLNTKNIYKDFKAKVENEIDERIKCIVCAQTKAKKNIATNILEDS